MTKKRLCFSKAANTDYPGRKDTPEKAPTEVEGLGTPYPIVG
jgi:hypothetical protein